MSLEFTYDDIGSGGGTDLAPYVKPSTISVPTRAEMGDTGNGVVPLDDMAGAVEIVGHRPFLVEESTCSQPRLFTGWTVERDYARQGEGGLIVETSRLAEVNIVDANAAAGFRLIWDTDGNRPEESWNDRLAWIVGSDYLGLIGGDTTFFGSYTQTMDAADYTGSTAGSVLDDLCERTGGVLNWFIFWNPDTSDLELFIKRESYTIGQCTLSISNIEAEVDGITVFKPDDVAKLAREPDQVYSEVIVEYGDGQKVYRTNAATAAAYIQRGTTISRPYTKRESTAIAQGDQWLIAHSYERDRITCTMRSVPASLVGLVRAGMGIDVKFSHFDVEGYADDYVTMRIVMCSPVPVSDIGDLYDISLELVNAAPAAPTEATFAVLTFAGGDNPSYPWDIYPPWRVCFHNTGDYYHAGDGGPYDDPLIGPLQYLDKTGTPTDGSGDNYAIQCLSDGVVDIEFSITAIEALLDWIDTAIKINGTAVETGHFDDPADPCILTVTDLEVHNGDIIEGWITSASGAAVMVPAGTGTSQQNHLMVSGTMVTPLTGETIPGPTQPSTTSHTTDPTVDDDEGAGYHVGDVWVNETTGEAWILVDDTDGAAVWEIIGGGDILDISTTEMDDSLVLAPDGAGGVEWREETGFANPMRVVGDLIYGDGNPVNKAFASLGATIADTHAYGLTGVIGSIIDGNDGSAVSQGNSAGGWTITITLDQSYVVSAVRLKGYNGNYGQPSAYDISYSLNGTDFTFLVTHSNPSYAGDQTYDIPPVDARYWRFGNAVAAGTSMWEINTIELFGDAPEDAGAPLRLPIGETDDVLTVVAGLPAWVAPAAAPTEITDIPTAEMDDSLVLAPDGAGGVEFRAEAGGSAEITDIPTAEMDDSLVLAPDGAGGVEWRAETGGAADILDIPTAETDDSLVLAPDGAGGVEWVAGGGGGFSPPAGVAGLWTWFKADALSGYSDNDTLLVWPNSVTGAVDGFDAHASGAPKYRTNVINSLPVVRFDGSAAYFRTVSYGITAPTISIFVVFKMTAITNAYSGVVGFGVNADGGGFFIKSNGKSALYPTLGTQYDGTGAITYDTTNWNYVSLICGPTTYSVRRNGSADVSGVAWGVNGIVYHGMLANQYNSGRLMNGDIAEFMVYARALTTTERDDIEDYLATKYGL